MSALEQAIGGLTRALGDFGVARTSSGAWSDGKRQELDRARLDPLDQEARHLLEALKRSARAIADAQSKLVR